VSREILFRILAALFVGASAYHAAAFFDPAFSQGGAPWRHAAFYGIDLLCAWFFLKRPLWFVFAFTVLTLETLRGHGSHAWMLWQTEKRLDWFSIVVIGTVLYAFLLLAQDAFGRGSRRSA
jgi:hypothetical protein